ncbi:type IV pilus biogenesis/stability protein PilW [Lysobacter korlensis]|uniref:Type IV pilus biogenesis/stability protein PilW n=1 Tax=Lysobacter korlensis TaxID=553636 RepID=A0ABV6RPC1_9GAMM
MPRKRQDLSHAVAPAARRASAVLGVLLLCASILAGCTRLSFVKPDVSRGGYERVAPEIDVKPTRRDNGAASLVNLARVRLQSGANEEALKLARQAVKRDPKSVDAHMLLALALDRSGAAGKAGVHHQRAAELGPTRGEAQNNYGVWLCGQGRAAESLRWFEAALAVPGYPTPSAALANIGTCALEAGQAALAERALRQAIEVDPENPVALAALAKLAFAKGRWLEARAFSQRRLAAAPPDVTSLQLASQIEQQLGDTAAARRYGEQMRKEFPAARNSRSGEVEGR